MTIEPFQPEHLRAMQLQRQQAYLREFITPEYLGLLAEGEIASSIRVRGAVVACFGITLDASIGRVLWCFFSSSASRHLVRLHRFARDFTVAHAYPFLHATVELGFEPGMRMLRMLGFSFVERREAFGPDGRTHLLFVKL